MATPDTFFDNKQLTIKQILIKVAVFSDLHATRLLLAIAEILWGMTLLAPGDTFGRPTYQVMAHVLMEDTWGWMWLISGLTQLYILYTGRYHNHFAVMFAALNSMLWWFITISMYMSVSPIPAAISGELALSIGAAWVWIRSGWAPKIERRKTL